MHILLGSKNKNALIIKNIRYFFAKLNMKSFYYVIENRPNVANLYLLKEFAQLN